MITLERDGKQMNLEPMNISAEGLKSTIERGRASLVIVEPGDMTRYVLLFAPVGTSLLVLRYLNPSETTKAIIYSLDLVWQGREFADAHAVGVYLSKGNEWTETILTHVIRRVFEILASKELST